MDFNRIKETDLKYYMPVFNRQPVCFTRGDKCTLYDADGKAYADFAGGIAVNCLGYNHPALVKAVSAQAAKLIHVSNLFYTEEQAEFTEKLLADSDFTRVFLCNSGAEANEGAIKLIRKYFYAKGERRPKILTALGSFHGRTIATAAATGQEKYSKYCAPLPEGFKHIPFNDLKALKRALDEDGDSTAAFMAETIQGENGVMCVDRAYIEGAYEICRRKGVLFVLDEVQTGMGRTGKLFSYLHFNFKPDIITLAKGIAAGVPMGAVLARGDVAEAFGAGDHGSTFGGNPLACAAGLVVLDLLKNGNLLKTVCERGDYLRASLEKLRKYRFVTDVRGRGLLQGLQLSDKINAGEVVGKMLSRGFILNRAGNNTLRFAPPYLITDGEIDGMTAALDKIFADADKNAIYTD